MKSREIVDNNQDKIGKGLQESRGLLRWSLGADPNITRVDGGPHRLVQSWPLKIEGGEPVSCLSSRVTC